MLTVLSFICVLIAVVAIGSNSHRNQKVKFAGEDAAAMLDSGNATIEEITAGLGMLIRRKLVTDPGVLAGFIKAVNRSARVNLPSKFAIRTIKMGALNDIVIIGAGTVHDYAYSLDTTHTVEHHHNCWLHVIVFPAEQQVDFYTAMPDDKDHKYLLEDFADHIFAKATQQALLP